jgi:hypothetical protein
VRNIEHGLKAMFVDIGFEKNAFLQFWDAIPAALDSGVEAVSREAGRKRGQKITHKDVPRIYPVGSDILVQVKKGPIGNKGPRIATDISLAGRYLVLMPFNDQCGISRKIDDPKDAGVMLSTLAMLAALDDGRARWWVAYGACTCGAVYTHYTVVFALLQPFGVGGEGIAELVEGEGHRPTAIERIAQHRRCGAQGRDGQRQQAQTDLEGAQKQAIAKRRNVCVSINAAGSLVSFTFASTAGSAALCDSNLTGPAGQNPYTVAAERIGAAIAPVSLVFGFDALGRPFNTVTFVPLGAVQAITITGDTAKTFSVEPETGYVHT